MATDTKSLVSRRRLTGRERPSWYLAITPSWMPFGNRYVVVHLIVNARSLNRRPLAKVAAFGSVNSSPTTSWSFSSGPYPRLAAEPLAADAVAAKRTASLSVDPSAHIFSPNTVAACSPEFVSTYWLRP
jgi:hypothetical protein